MVHLPWEIGRANGRVGVTAVQRMSMPEVLHRSHAGPVPLRRLDPLGSEAGDRQGTTPDQPFFADNSWSRP